MQDLGITENVDPTQGLIPIVGKGKEAGIGLIDVDTSRPFSASIPRVTVSKTESVAASFYRSPNSPSGFTLYPSGIAKGICISVGFSSTSRGVRVRRLSSGRRKVTLGYGSLEEVAV